MTVLPILPKSLTCSSVLVSQELTSGFHSPN